MYYTYILTNQWKTVLYIGMTNNLERRMFDTKAGSKSLLQNDIILIDWSTMKNSKGQ